MILAVSASSGFCALAYEVLFVRHLTTLLGDMLYVHAALLSTFLVGVGLGARLAHRAHRWLFAFEMGAGLYALVLPWITDWLGGLPGLAGVVGAPGATVAVTVALVAAPSFLVGFTVPLLAAYARSLAPDRLAFRPVYALYNAGAFAGILLVELVGVRVVGIPGALAGVGVLNVLNGLALFAVRAGTLPRPAASALRFRSRLLWTLALASGASAVFQMLFLQTLYLVFGPHRENFAVGLAVVLAGIALGTVLVARTGLRFRSLLRAVPLALALPFLAHVPLVRVYQALLPHAAAAGDAAILALKLATAGAYGLPALLLFGGLIPAILRREGAVGEESGRLLWVSSLANAAGYLAYVLVLHEALPTHALLVGIGAAALAGLGLVGGEVGRRRETAWPVTTAIGAAALAVLAVAWSEPRLYLARWLNELRPEADVTVFKDGAGSATLVETPRYRWVSYNGHPSIYVSTDGVVNVAEVMSGVIPALAAPRLERAAVLGVGTGITAGTVATLFQHTDVVEINPAFIRMLPRLADANFGLADNPRATLHVTDARAFLPGREAEYDAIINSIPAPTYFSAGKIYTVEFYRRVARALRPDGIFSTWLAPPEMTRDGVRTVLATLRRVFPYCDLRRMRRQYYMATCSRQPIRARPYPAVAPTPPVDAALRAGLDTDRPTQTFRDHRLSRNILVDPSLASVRINTDAYPVLEFQVARTATIEGDAHDPFADSPARYGIQHAERPTP